MRYGLLGRSGLRLSDMCLGTRTFGEDWGWGALAIVEELRKVAAEVDRSPSQVALAWVRQPGVIPILGARKVSQPVDNLGALDSQLPSQHMERLPQASAFELGSPHEFLARDGIRELVYGGTYGLIDNHRE